MGKTVPMEHAPYVPCSKMKPCDLGSISKSLEASMVKMQALTRGLEGKVHTRSTTSSHGVPREPKPPDLYQEEHLLPYECSKSSSTLRGKGITPSLPSFNGENSRAFVSWLFDVECYFENKFFSDSRKCEMVVSCLKGVALLWHNTLNYSRRMEGKSRIRSWFKLEKKMRLKFLPCSILNDLWAELKNLKQNSLSVIEYAKLFEELHFVCDIEVGSFQRRIRFYLGLKSEIARRINLEKMQSYGELFELALYVERSLGRPKNQEVFVMGDRLEAIETDGNENGLNREVVMPSLDIACSKSKPLEPKVMNTYAKMNSSCSAIFGNPCPEIKTPFNSTHEPTSEEESSHTLSNKAINDQATDLGPREVILDQGLLKLQTKEFGQYTGLFDCGTCWESIKDKAKGETWVVPCSSVPNLTSYISHGSCLKSYILGGITCALSTPHFHFYMLVRLQVSLVHLSANSYILEVKDGEMNRFKTCCPILEFMCLRLNFVQIHCESLLELFGTSSTRSLHGLEGVVTHLVMLVSRVMHENRNEPFVALLCSTRCVNTPYGLSLGDYMLLVVQCGEVVVKLGVKPPWPLLDRYMSSIERKVRMGISGDNEPFMAMKLPTLLAEFEGGTYIRPSQATMNHTPKRIRGAWMGEQSECGNGTTHLLPFTILVYDPGGSHERHLLKCAWSFDKWEDKSLGNKVSSIGTNGI